MAGPRAAAERLELVVLAAGPPGDAALVLASYRGARVRALFPRRGDAAGARWRRIIRAHERALAALDGRGGTLPEGRELVALGRDLFEALLPGDVRRLYDAARAQAGRGALDLVLASMLDWVADKPWELAFDPARREHLATSSVNFVRDAWTAVPAEARIPRRRGRLRVLIVVSRPRGRAPLDTRAETEGVRRAFRPLTRAARAELEVLTRPTAGALQRRLARGDVDVLHFVGHGHYDERAREGVLVLEDERGEARLLPASALRQVVCQRGLGLVFLNACETARGGRSDWNRGTAAALAAGGVRAVVANQYPVLDEAATLFARELYAALAAGRALGDAAREARVALAREIGEARMGWAVPVVFARDPRERLR